MQYMPMRLGGTPQWLKDTLMTVKEVAPIAGGFVGAATGTAALTNFSAALAGQEVSSGYAGLYATEQQAALRKQQMEQQYQLQQNQMAVNRELTLLGLTSSGSSGGGSTGFFPEDPGSSGPDMGLIVALAGGALLLVAMARR